MCAYGLAIYELSAVSSVCIVVRVAVRGARTDHLPAHNIVVLVIGHILWPSYDDIVMRGEHTTYRPFY